MTEASRAVLPDTLGAYLNQLRQARGISPTALARSAQISRATLYNWEGERFEPRLHELEAVLSGLQVSALEREQALRLLNARRGHQALQAMGATSPLLPHCGDLLRALRVRQNRTQEQLARQLEVRQGTIARWERGELPASTEMLHRICTILRAHPEEAQALQAGQFPVGDTLPLSQELIAARLAEVNQRLLSASEHLLGDLLYLSLEAQAASLLTKHETARFLLAEILLHHAKYLGAMCQPADAGRIGERALELLPSRGEQWNAQRLAGEMYWTVWKCPHRDHARQLNHWLTAPLPLSSRAWVASQISGSLLEQGEYEAGLALSRASLDATEATGDEAKILHRRNDYAETLIEIGRAAEAAELLTIVETNPPPSRLRTKLVLCEAHLAAGNRSQAHGWLSQVLADKATLNLSYYDPEIQTLTAQF